MECVPRILRTIPIIIIAFVLTTTCSLGASDVVIKSYNSVPTLVQGQSYSIYGTIESKKKMTRVEIGVVNSAGDKWITKYDKKISSNKFNISVADPYVKFGTLSAGTYKYRVYAHINKRVYTLRNQSFTVKSKPIRLKNVKEQQEFLNKVNVGSAIGTLSVDGDRGQKTIASIKIFQQIEGLEVDGVWGKATDTASNRSIKVDGKRMAMNWACSIANDNSFAYGSGSRAHRSGCYFCKTNTGDRKWKKEKSGEPHYVKDSKGKKHTYEKTYCCNPFITAAYAHGAKDAKLLSICRSGSSCGMTPNSWTRSKNFRVVGKAKSVPFSKLKAGDVIISDSSNGGKFHHVWMYIGHNRCVEATGGNWSASSIEVGGGVKSSYEKYYAKYNGVYVVRYTK